MMRYFCITLFIVVLFPFTFCRFFLFSHTLSLSLYLYFLLNINMLQFSSYTSNYFCRIYAFGAYCFCYYQNKISSWDLVWVLLFKFIFSIFYHNGKMKFIRYLWLFICILSCKETKQIPFTLWNNKICTQQFFFFINFWMRKCARHLLNSYLVNTTQQWDTI